MSKRYIRKREEMVRSQIEARGIKDPRVLAAFRMVPRHLFVSEALREQAYIVAEMTQALELKKDDRVLEIGTGSGYQAAILAQIVYRVYTVERRRSLYMQARSLFGQLNYHNIVTKYADGTKGWQEESPFDAIAVTAGAPELPDLLVHQLAKDGRRVVPVGNQHTQELIKIFRDREKIQQTNLGGCRFVKLVGEHGWKEG